MVAEVASRRGQLLAALVVQVRMLLCNMFAYVTGHALLGPHCELLDFCFRAVEC